MNATRTLPMILVLTVVAACGTPGDVNNAKGNSGLSGISDAVSQVVAAYKATQPDPAIMLPPTIIMMSSPQTGASVKSPGVVRHKHQATPAARRTQSPTPSPHHRIASN